MQHVGSIHFIFLVRAVHVTQDPTPLSSNTGTATQRTTTAACSVSTKLPLSQAHTQRGLSVHTNRKSSIQNEGPCNIALHVERAGIIELNMVYREPEERGGYPRCHWPCRGRAWEIMDKCVSASQVATTCWVSNPLEMLAGMGGWRPSVCLPEMSRWGTRVSMDMSMNREQWHLCV